MHIIRAVARLGCFGSSTSFNAGRHQQPRKQQQSEEQQNAEMDQPSQPEELQEHQQPEQQQAGPQQPLPDDQATEAGQPEMQQQPEEEKPDQARPHGAAQGDDDWDGFINLTPSPQAKPAGWHEETRCWAPQPSPASLELERAVQLLAIPCSEQQPGQQPQHQQPAPPPQQQPAAERAPVRRFLEEMELRGWTFAVGDYVYVSRGQAGDVLLDESSGGISLCDASEYCEYEQAFLTRRGLGLACIDSLWAGGSARLRWLYLPEETRGGRQPDHGQCEVFWSNDLEDVDLATLVPAPVCVLPPEKLGTGQQRGAGTYLLQRLYCSHSGVVVNMVRPEPQGDASAEDGKANVPATAPAQPVPAASVEQKENAGGFGATQLPAKRTDGPALAQPGGRGVVALLPRDTNASAPVAAPLDAPPAAKQDAPAATKQEQAASSRNMTQLLAKFAEAAAAGGDGEGSGASAAAEHLGWLPSAGPLPDIDSADAQDPLAGTDWAQGIFAYYKRVETRTKVAHDYMSRQKDITPNMRMILVDWLVDIHLKWRLRIETLHLAVNLIDRYLEAKQVERKRLQLVGATGMLIASKYEDIDRWTARVGDLVAVCDNAYTRAEVTAMEKDMLRTLGFNVSVPTPCRFLERYLKAAGFAGERELMLYANYLLQLALVDCGGLRFPYSQLTCAAIATAAGVLGRPDPFCEAAQRHSGYSLASLAECGAYLGGLARGAATAAVGSEKPVTINAVYRKYSKENRSKVAMLPAPPAPAPALEG